VLAVGYLGSIGAGRLNGILEDNGSTYMPLGQVSRYADMPVLFVTDAR